MKRKNIFSEEAIRSFVELGTVFRQIHSRLVVEGKVKVVNGKVIFLDNKQKDDTTSRVQRQSGQKSKRTYGRRDIQVTRTDG